MSAKFKMWLLILAVIVVGFANALPTNAQITYTSGKLSIEGAPAHSYLGMTINKMNGLYWTCKTSNFFQLDLTPANPRIAGTGNQVVFYNSATGKFNSIQVENVYNYSDARAKTNIRNLETGLGTLLNLRPVSYNWIPTSVDRDNADNSTKGTMSVADENETTQYGFIAQEVEEILPDAVITDEEGRKLINYTAVIPVLVKSVQELQAVIDGQAATISVLQSQIAAKGIAIEPQNKLLGCSPNPTAGDIKFSYNLERSANTAYILISDLTGNQEMKITCHIDEKSVTSNLGSLRSGLHIATLVVDGNVSDSKQVVVNH